MERLEPQKFFNETLAHLEKMEKKLMRLKIEPDNQEILDSVFNSVYSIRRSSIRVGTKYKAPPSESIKQILKSLHPIKKGADSEILAKLNIIKNQIEQTYRHIAYIFLSK
jgi:chemotaxis protein histidine kinase CheA